MKAKKLFAGLLAAVMTASAIFMTGCSNSNSEEDAANTTSTRDIVTLNMYIMTDKETTVEAANKVQMEINRRLLPEYKTMIKINYINEEEYWDIIEEKQKLAKSKMGGAEEEAVEETAEVQADAQTSTADTDAALGEEGAAKEEVLKSDGAVKGTEGKNFNELIDFIYEQKDIELKDPNQFDIFVVDDYTKYQQMALDGDLAPIDEYLKYRSLELNQYIYPTFMSAARIGKSIYGVPNNTAIESEFTYFVFDKSIMEKVNAANAKYNEEKNKLPEEEKKNLPDKKIYNIAGFTTYASLESYLKDVKENSEIDAWPISGYCDLAGAEMYDEAFLAYSNDIKTLPTLIKPALTVDDYESHLIAVDSFAKAGYYPKTPDENAKYAVRIETSKDLRENPEWEEDGTTYAAYLYDINRVQAEEAFTSAMCISAYSENKERSMEIITLFNTDPEFANLLQYGIEGENYQYNEEENFVTMLTDAYSMNTKNTGNIYVKYPVEGEQDYVSNAIKYNLMSAPSVYLGYAREFESMEEELEYQRIKAMCLATQKAIEQDGADMREALNKLDAELRKNHGNSYMADKGAYEGALLNKLLSGYTAQLNYTKSNYKIDKRIAEYNDFFVKQAEQEALEQEENQVTDEIVAEEPKEDDTTLQEDVQDGAVEESVDQPEQPTETPDLV